MSGKKVVLAIMFLVFLAPLFVWAGEGDELFFSPEEMTAAYRYQYWLGHRIHKPIKETDSGNYETLVDGQKVIVPKKFVEHITEHVVQMIRAGSARYIFRPDLGHCHMFLPKEKIGE